MYMYSRDRHICCIFCWPILKKKVLNHCCSIHLQMLSSKDLNFVGYTYKNFELVNEHEASGIGLFLSLHFIRVNILTDQFWFCFDSIVCALYEAKTAPSSLFTNLLFVRTLQPSWKKWANQRGQLSSLFLVMFPACVYWIFINFMC